MNTTTKEAKQVIKAARAAWLANKTSETSRAYEIALTGKCDSDDMKNRLRNNSNGLV